MSETPLQIDYELLASYLAGEASADQARMVAEWATVPANGMELERMKALFALEPSLEPNAIDVDAAWESLEKRIMADENEKAAHRVGTSTLWPRGAKWALRAAAILVFGSALYLATAKWVSGPQEETFASHDQKVQAALPDGSHATINVESSLEYLQDGQRGERRAILVGEGYFEIKHKENQAFVVETQWLDVRVVGTAFNVWAPKGNDSARVDVVEGKVEVTDKRTNRSIFLGPGESTLYVRDKRGLATDTSGPLDAHYWRTGDLVFKAARLEEVAAALSKAYGTKIIVDKALGHCRISASFSRENLDTILEVISGTLNLSVHKTKRGYALKGTGC
jgi:ferric-dicitrate binding protein FerR (iron transport regulator)